VIIFNKKSRAGIDMEAVYFRYARMFFLELSVIYLKKEIKIIETVLGPIWDHHWTERALLRPCLFFERQMGRALTI